jgi:uncharacterized protein
MTTQARRFQVEKALTLRARLVGLLGRKQLGRDQALWIEPCQAIHTCGMRFSIDVVFIDRNGRIKRIDEFVRPWRLRWCNRSMAAVELAAGQANAARLAVGQRWAD